jgi:AcrR family transcriptional regulator
MSPQKTKLNPRKKPRQDRSQETVRIIQEAAIRVLKKHGGIRFTTIRVAAEAGISVGSLYQYFPNKESLLFQLHQLEWESTRKTVEAIMDQQGKPPWERFSEAVHAFFKTEAEEAELRKALSDAGAYYDDTPEFRAFRQKGQARLRAFVRELYPQLSRKELEFRAAFLAVVVTSVAEEITSRSTSLPVIERWADETIAMLSGRPREPLAGRTSS